MILAIDTSTALAPPHCSTATGACLRQRDELIGRGHSERLVPMLDELLDGRRANCNPGRSRSRQLHRDPRRDRRCARACDRLERELAGMSSLALLAAGAERGRRCRGRGGRGPWRTVRAAVRRRSLEATSTLLNLPPADAAANISRAGGWVGRDRTGRGASRWGRPPTAGRARRTHCGFRNRFGRCRPSRSTLVRPMRGRGGGMIATPLERRIPPRERQFVDLDDVMSVMNEAFDPQFGEAWTRSQCAGILPMSGVSLMLAAIRRRPIRWASPCTGRSPTRRSCSCSPFPRNFAGRELAVRCSISS